MVELADTRLSYSHIFGSPEFLQGVAGLYQDLKPEQVIPTHGAIGANNQVITTLIGAEDNMVSVMPTYQQHYSIPESIGADVRLLQLTLEDDFLPNLDVLRSLVDENTKMITINNPNNPTGSWIPVDVMKEIIEIAKSVDAYVLCDEVYRGISEDGSYMQSIVDLYDKGISVGKHVQGLLHGRPAYGMDRNKVRRSAPPVPREKRLRYHQLRRSGRQAGGSCPCSQGADLCQKQKDPEHQQSHPGPVGAGNAGGPLSETGSRYHSACLL